MPDLWPLPLVATRFLTYAGVLGSVGLVLVGLAFPREVAGLRRTLFRVASAFAALTLVASGLGFALKGAILTGSASGMADPEILAILWATPAGTELQLLGAGSILILAGIAIPGVPLPVAGVGGIVALASFTRIGHVHDTGQVLLQAVLVFHLAAAAFWLGILFPLWRLAARPDNWSTAASLGRRFGSVAQLVVPGLILAGVVMAWRLVGNFADLVGTAYGITLLVKAAGVALLLCAAAVNKLRLVPALSRGDPEAASALRISVALESAAFVGILLATAVLTTAYGAPAAAGP